MVTVASCLLKHRPDLERLKAGAQSFIQDDPAISHDNAMRKAAQFMLQGHKANVAEIHDQVLQAYQVSIHAPSMGDKNKSPDNIVPANTDLVKPLEVSIHAPSIDDKTKSPDNTANTKTATLRTKVKSPEGSRDGVYYSIAEDNGFYSQLAKAFEQLPAKVNKTSAANVKAWLLANADKLRIKKDEIAWSGILDYLDLQGQNKLSKADVLTYLQQGGVKLEETTLGAVDTIAGDEATRKQEAYEQTLSSKYKTDDWFNELTEDEHAQWRNLKGNADRLAAVVKNPTKFHDYQLPGGTNYKELLLTLPLKKTDMAARNEAYAAFARGEITREQRNSRIDKAMGVIRGYTSQHFDQTNILAHVRFNERMDDAGNKVLFLEELQSDQAADIRAKKITTSAPFVTETKAWTALALKRMLTYAVENGFDKVAWTTGTQQTERYDLGKKIDRLYYKKNADGTYSVDADPVNGGSTISVGKAIPEDKLQDHIGKDVAEKIINDEGRTSRDNEGFKFLKGLDLKIGGEGMLAFYDNIVPQVANQVLKSIGGNKVEGIKFGHIPELTFDEMAELLKDETAYPIGSAVRENLRKDMGIAYDISTGDNSLRSTQQGFSITPAMKAKVSAEGLPLFSQKEVEKNKGRAGFENLAATTSQQHQIKTTLEGENKRDRGLHGIHDRGHDLSTEINLANTDSNVNTAHTVEQIESLLPTAARRLLAAGKLEILQSTPEGINKKAQGYYSKKLNKVFLITDNLNKDNLPGILRHEIFHYLLRNDAKLADAVASFNDYMTKRLELASKGLGTKIENDSHRRVIAAKTDPFNQLEEFNAHLIEIYNTAPESLSASIRKAISDFIAAIRVAMLRAGYTFKTLTAADLNALVMRGLRDANVDDKNKTLSDGVSKSDIVASKDLKNSAAVLSLADKTRDNYENRIDELFTNNITAKPRGIKVLDKSDILDMLGFGNHEVVLAEEHTIKDGSKKHPEITAEDWKSVPEWLDNPDAVYERKDGRLTFIAPVKESRALIIGVFRDTDKKVHIALTAYRVKEDGRARRDSNSRPVDSYSTTLSPELRAHVSNDKLVYSGSFISIHAPFMGDKNKAPGNTVLTKADLVKYQNENNLSTDNANAFSRGSAAEALKELAKVDDFFRFPISNGETIEAVMRDILPIAKYRGAVSNKNRHIFVLPKSETQGNQPFYVYEKDGKIWIDVSQLETGTGGSAIYFAVGNYAKNSEQVFIGDPDGLSEDAVIRRTANMLSMALRFGTTDFMEPAKEQKEGQFNTEPVVWKGTDKAKTEALIHSFITNLHTAFPEIKNARYDFKKGQFMDGRGSPIDRGSLHKLGEGRHTESARKARAGSNTIGQGILIQSLISSKGRERPGILEQILNRDSSLSEKGLDKLFSKSKNNTNSVLLAPNGKPSNLNVEQHSLIRTLEFKKWFGVDWETEANIKELIVGIPTNITGKEVADFSEPRDMKSLRHKAFLYGEKEVVGTYKNIRSGLTLEIRPGGIDETIRHGSAQDKLKAIAALPDVTTKGVVVYDGINPKNTKNKLIVVSKRVAINEKVFVVTAGFREDINGRLFYDHEMFEVKQVEGLSSKPSEGALSTRHPAPTATRLNDYYTQFIAKSNLIDRDAILREKLQNGSPFKTEALTGTNTALNRDAHPVGLSSILHRIYAVKATKETKQLDNNGEPTTKAIKDYLDTGVKYSLAEGGLDNLFSKSASEAPTGVIASSPPHVYTRERNVNLPLVNDGVKPYSLNTSEGFNSQYPKASTTVDGREVLKTVKNSGSIDSSLDNYEILPGIREVNVADFTQAGELKYYSKSERERTQALAAEIKASKEISPLIVVIDEEGPYILEGGHRFDALREVGANSFPALVVIDRDAVPVNNEVTKRTALIDELVSGVPFVISGKEFADFTEPLNMKSLRRSAFLYGEKHVVGKYKNIGSGLTLEIRPGGIDESIQHGGAQDKLKAIAALPDITANGVVVYDGNNPKKQNERLIVVSKRVSIGGRVFMVTAGFREDTNNKLFYDHELLAVKLIEGLSSQSSANLSIRHPAPTSTSLNEYTTRFIENSNNDALFSIAPQTDLQPGQRIVGNSGRTYTPEQIAAMQRTGGIATDQTIKARLKELWKDIGKKTAQNLVDQFAPVKELSAHAYMLLRQSKGATGAFEAFMRYGKLSLQNGVTDADTSGGALNKVFQPLGLEATDFLRWVAGNRAERLTAEDRENLFTAEDIAAYKSLNEGEMANDYTLLDGTKTKKRALAYQDSLKKFNEFHKNAIDIAEQSGLIDPTSRAIWEHEFYVPFYRIAEDDNVRGMDIKSGVVRQEAFKKLKGGTDKLNDLLANTLQNWAHLIDASAKNRAAKATVEAAARTGIATVAQAGDKNTVWHMDNGQKVYHKIDDPYIMTALTALEYAGLRGPVMDALSATKRVLTVGVTASPFFKIRNLIRDSVQAIGVSELSYNPGKNIVQGFKLTNKNNISQTYVSALAGGGLIRFGTMLEGNDASRTRKLIDSGVNTANILDSDSKIGAMYDKYFAPAIDAYNELGNRSEEITRIALYKQLIDKGVDHATASFLARDTMDFSMQGAASSVRLLTQVVPFMNARLQGLYKLGRAAKEDPARMAIVVGAVSLVSLALLAAYSDDDDWKKREDWDRDNYWWFKVGGEAFRIPKPFEIGAAATLVERTAELMFDDEMTGGRFAEVVAHNIGNQLSMNPTPQLFKPIIDIYANKDSFTGRPIETMGMERLDPDYRFTSKTSMTARGLSTAGNAISGGNFLSPVQIDHLAQAYFGWMGVTTLTAADLIIRGVNNEPTQPAIDYIKRATGGMVQSVDSGQSRYVSRLYAQAKELEQAYGTFNRLRKEGKGDEAEEYKKAHVVEIGSYKKIETIKRMFSKINAGIREVERSDLSASVKKERILGLKKTQDNLARKAFF